MSDQEGLTKRRLLAELLVRLHVEPHGEEQELEAGDHEQGHEHRGGRGNRIAEDTQNRVGDPGRDAQAEEILDGPANTPLPVVLVCDCNSSANAADPDATPTYALLRNAGFGDAWATKHPGADGLTCCQDADLRNVPSTLFERLDYILSFAKTPSGRTAVDPSALREWWDRLEPRPPRPPTPAGEVFERLPPGLRSP